MQMSTWACDRQFSRGRRKKKNRSASFGGLFLPAGVLFLLRNNIMTFSQASRRLLCLLTKTMSTHKHLLFFYYLFFFYVPRFPGEKLLCSLDTKRTLSQRHERNLLSDDNQGDLFTTAAPQLPLSALDGWSATGLVIWLMQRIGVFFLKKELKKRNER